MPTPNWGSKNGVPMNDLEFSDYMNSEPPPGTIVNGVNWGGRVPNPNQHPADRTQDLSPLAEADRGASYWQDYFTNRAAAGMDSSGLPQFNLSNQDQARAQQNQVIQDLQGQAAGSLDTGAQRQLRQGYQQAGAQQSSIGSSVRGQSAGAAMRGIQSGQAGIQRGFGGDQQMLKLQEQQAAQAMLAQLLAQQHQQDLTQARDVAMGGINNQRITNDMQRFYDEAAVNAGLGIAQRRSNREAADYGYGLDAQDFATRNIARGQEIAGTAIDTLRRVSDKNRNSSGSDESVAGQNYLEDTTGN